MTIDELLIQNPPLADAVSVLIDSVKASGDTEALEKWDNLRMDSEINSYPIRMTPEERDLYRESLEQIRDLGPFITPGIPDKAYVIATLALDPEG